MYISTREVVQQEEFLDVWLGQWIVIVHIR